MKRRASIPTIAFTGAFLVFAFMGYVHFAHAQSVAPSSEDFQAALAEANAMNSIMTNRAQQLAVELGRAKREVTQLRSELAKAKAPPIEPPKETKP